MLKYFKEILYNKSDDAHENDNYELKIKISTCALFLEIANSDEEFTIEEENKIIEIMKKTFDLSEENVEDLIHLAEEQIKKSISLYDYTSVINQYLNKDEKIEIVKNLWRLIFVDKKLQPYEEYFLKKIANNLHLSHDEMIGTKLIVKKELGLTRN